MKEKINQSLKSEESISNDSPISVKNIDEVAKTDEEKAVISHWLHNINTPSAKTYEAHAREILPNSIIEELTQNELCQKEEAPQQLLFQDLFDVPFPPPEDPKFTFIDLFAGIGGFRIAMQNLGGKCVFSSEWDEHAQKTYFANFGEVPFGDITKIKEEEIPNFDILCGGFPCQAFSIAGKQKGFDDTRGTLFFDIVRIIKYHKPKILFLENVKNLEKHNKGETFKVIVKTLINLGYDLYYKVLNASDYGLPQNRERIFIVGFRKDLNVRSFTFPAPIKKQISIKDIIESDSDAKIIKRTDMKIYKEFKPEKNIFGEIELPNKPLQIGIVNKGGQGERIYSYYGHACTLSAYGGGVGSKTGIYLIDGVCRKLSSRECARVQGFPDTFIVNKNQGQAYKQFGNSVAVNVLKAIAKQILKEMRSDEE